jgi:hypothetical protein
MRAMTSLHVGMNAIPEKEMKEIIVIAMSKDNMKLLCEVPIKDKTLTKLDVSGKSLGIEGALVVAEYLRDNGALSVLNLASNNLGELVLPGGWAKRQVESEEEYNAYGEEVFVHTDGTKQKQAPGGSKPGGVIALANAIPDMGAMTSLDLASNRLGAEGAKIVAGAFKVTMCTPAIILAPFSCPSDFSINCCCLLLSAGYEGTRALSSLNLASNNLGGYDAYTGKSDPSGAL